MAPVYPNTAAESPTDGPSMDRARHGVLTYPVTVPWILPQSTMLRS